MANSAYRVTCSVCGRSFVPPQGAARFFCPNCGMRMSAMPATMTSEQAQDQAALAVEQAARAAEQAAQAARLAGQEGMRIESVDEANEAVRKAMEAVRMAQEAARAQGQFTQEQRELLEQSKAEFDRTMREIQQRDAAAAAARQAQAQAEAQRQAAAQAEAQRQAQAQAEAQRQAAQQKPVEYRRNVTVRHTDGRGLYTVTIPVNWAIQKTEIRQQRTRRYNPYVVFTDGDGSSITLRQGDAGTRLSSGMKALMNTYGAAIAGVDRTNYAEMPNPVNVADTYTIDITKQVDATELRLAKTVPSSDLPARQQDAMKRFRDAGAAVGNTLMKDPFAAELLRIYTFNMNGQPQTMAVYVRLYAVKDASGVENLSPVGLMFNAGSALGGLFSKKRQQQRAPQQVPRPASQEGAWSIPAYDSYVSGGTIYWDVCGFATLMAPQSRFEEILNTAFMPLVRSYDIHSDMINLANAAASQEAAQVQAATNRQINAMNMQTQATLAAARQASAASSAQVDAYLRQSEAHHQAFRERTNAQFNTGYGGSSAPDFSEAIRGVNTYMTSDGREVELDVSADRAYENQAGDVIGGSGGFDPGADWTEIPRV